MATGDYKKVKLSKETKPDNLILLVDNMINPESKSINFKGKVKFKRYNTLTKKNH